MLIDCVAFVSPVGLPLSQWNPDQWVALVKTTVWPVFWTVMVVGWRAKVGELLSSLTAAIHQAGEISLGPFKIVRMKAEDIASVKDGDPKERYEWLAGPAPGSPGGAPYLVHEKLTRMP